LAFALGADDAIRTARVTAFEEAKAFVRQALVDADGVFRDELEVPAVSTRGFACRIAAIEDDDFLAVALRGIGEVIRGRCASQSGADDDDVGDRRERLVRLEIRQRVAAAEPDALEGVSPIFGAISQRTFVVADDPAAASLVKLSGNFLIASVIESLGEAMALVGKAGVDKQQYLDILTSTLFGAPVYQTYGGLIARGEFEPAGFAATLGLKDVRLVLAAGEDLRVPLPIASLLRDRFLALLAGGGEALDWAAVGALAEWEAGGPRPGS